jgi:hypothetical protein
VRRSDDCGGAVATTPTSACVACHAAALTAPAADTPPASQNDNGASPAFHARPALPSCNTNAAGVSVRVSGFHRDGFSQV